MEDKDTNQAQLGRDANVGEAYVSVILKGKTNIGRTQIKDKYYLALCNAIGYSIDVKIWRHFNTQNFKTIINELKKARQNKSRLVIDADTGAGKTYACKKYKQKYPNNTFVVKCLAIENSKEFAINIAEVVGVETHGTAGSIIKRVAKKLLSLDDVVLIIDEAEHIGKKSGYINIIKSVADLFEGKIAFVLLGMGISKILKTGFDKNKQNFRQTARRFSKREECETNISEDVIKICQELELKKVVQAWFANRMRNYDEFKVLVVEAIEEAKKLKQPVTVELLNTLYQ
ncbi:AAA family ATPase [Tenacibaculum maritimum]|uniref:AAA family ATPase n=1 Tax=Tenacibaculum maritimum TaxID=107401 RepID=UPI003876C408